MGKLGIENHLPSDNDILIRSLCKEGIKLSYMLALARLHMVGNIKLYKVY